MTEFATVGREQFFALGLGAVLAVVIPIAIAIIWKFRKHEKFTTILVGAATFVLFALILEKTIQNALVFPTTMGLPDHAASQFINARPILWAIVRGLFPGVFEETGRFIAMKWLLKKEPGTALTAVGYGVGHGGIEMMLIYGITMISNVALAGLINSGQADTILASAPAGTLDQIQAQFQQLQDMSAWSYLTGIWERVSAIILQLSLSVLVWASVRKGGKFLWLFPAAILIHFLVDAGAVVLSKSTTMVITEIILFAEALAVAAMAWMIAKQLKEPVLEA